MLCHIFQQRIETEIDELGRVRSPALQKHLDKCPACQYWLHSLKQIEQHLDSTSPKLPESQLQQIQSNILNNLPHHQTTPTTSAAHHQPTRHRIIHIFTAAAAIIALAIGLFTFFSPTPASKPSSQPDQPQFTMKKIEHIPEQLQLQIPILASLPEQMMESEMQNLESDLRDAIGFMQSCLPRGFIVANHESENKAG